MKIINNKFNKQFTIWKSGQIIEKILCPICNKNWIYKKSKSCKSCGKMGTNNPFYGKNHSILVKLKISTIQRKRKRIKKPKEYCYCNICNTEILTSSKYCKKCYGILIKGNNNPAKKLDVRKKISENISGPKNGSWRGGISWEIYTEEWSSKLTESIRLRDEYKCKICGKPQNILLKKLHVHHINYNKKDCNPNNLISLCGSCHQKTNFKRDLWIIFFNKLNRKEII